MVATDAKKLKRLLTLIANNPGCTASGLEAIGWTPRWYGSLKDAQDDGYIRWDTTAKGGGGGWVVVAEPVGDANYDKELV